ncbi:hypothetical protein AVEN_63056-1 [Araneus ventricosus]|uniref:Uncharacterized protein n=1 Tax=Araneus ventricosus TaxID=182803 RepID=A0A4Y2H0E9_ARAVE|nr:hypothetical protein AVEN_63056-1 [Araneus ventricosus]
MFEKLVDVKDVWVKRPPDSVEWKFGEDVTISAIVSVIRTVFKNAKSFPNIPEKSEKQWFAKNFVYRRLAKLHSKSNIQRRKWAEDACCPYDDFSLAVSDVAMQE